jgi:CubicO group peptidase (beta-lactamase class C family)
MLVAGLRPPPLPLTWSILMTSASKGRPKTARELGIMRGFPPPPEKRPSLENWDLPPFNRWSFQNIRSLFPTVDVRRGEAPPRTLLSDDSDLENLSFQRPDGTRTNVGAWLSNSYTDGFIVLHNGKIVTEHYANDMAADTSHLGQSLSKSMIGCLAGCVFEDGNLDLDAPLADIVPELAVCGYADATLNQVLDMRSGVGFVEDYGLPDSDMTRVDIAAGWRPSRRGEIRPTIRDVILSLKKEREHGGYFSYRSIETDVVAWVLERVTGENIANLLSSRIWQPLRCEHHAFLTVDEEGTALADGGINATLRDYARFGQMVLDGGRFGDQVVVPPAWINDLTDNCDPTAHGDPYDILSPNGAYCRFWWVHKPSARQLMARGVFGQLIFIDRVRQVVAVKLSSWPDYLIPAFNHEAVVAVSNISRALQK